MNKAVTRAKKATGGKTKYEIVIEAMTDHRPTSRKAAIALVVEAADMTPAGASTYVAKANKELKLW